MTKSSGLDAGLYVFDWRSARGWTQTQAAKWYGCSEREWRRWETGEVKVPLPVLHRLRATRKRVRSVV